MNKTKIDWPGLDYTWNPITGCLHGCPYCYAKKIAMRFEGHFNPTLHTERLEQPVKIKKPSKIFVGSMTDMWGDFISWSWIHTVLDVIRKTPQHEYMFLTKNPSRYKEFAAELYGLNVWLGATIETPLVAGGNRMRIMQEIHNVGFKTFLSAEPLLGSFAGWNLNNAFDLVIAGGINRGPKHMKTHREWFKTLDHKNLHIKRRRG